MYHRQTNEEKGRKSAIKENNNLDVHMVYITWMDGYPNGGNLQVELCNSRTKTVVQKGGDIRKILAPYLPRRREDDISPSMLSRAKQKSGITLHGDDGETVKMFPLLKQSLEYLGHHVDVSYCGQEEMRGIVRKKKKADYKLWLTTLSPQERRRQPTFENSNVELPEIPPDQRYVKSACFAPGTLDLDNFTHFIVCDACHSNKSGLIFSAWTYSSNKNAVCVASIFHILNECESSWADFYSFLTQVFPAVDNSNSVIVSDGDKGGANAAKKMLSECSLSLMQQTPRRQY